MKAGSRPRAPRYWVSPPLGWLRNSPPAPLTRSVAAISVPFSFEIICWIGPPGAACTIKKLTTMIANKVGSISAMRRIAYAIIDRGRPFWTSPHPNPPPLAGEGGTRAAGVGGLGRATLATSLGHLALFRLDRLLGLWIDPPAVDADAVFRRDFRAPELVPIGDPER